MLFSFSARYSRPDNIIADRPGRTSKGKVHLNTLPACLIILYLFGSSCNQTSGNGTGEPGLDSVLMGISTVDENIRYMVLQETKFSKELLANGKLSSTRKADLKFRTSGIIKEVLVHEGQHVQVGQLLARLDEESAMASFNAARLSYEQAVLDYEDQLLRSGYKISDTARLSADTKSVARLRSGLGRAILTLRQAENELKETKLVAPFSGIIANLKAMPFNNSNSYEFICSLIDDRRMEVSFKVLEQELSFIRRSGLVTIRPFSQRGESGVNARVQSINPLVDGAGMIEVKALLSEGGNSALLDGMNVRVHVQEQLSGQLVVPKEAVLDRQHRKVVFTLVDSLAQWNYVEISGENSSQYAISKGLKSGDKVIYEGNFNLAHDKIIHGAKGQ
ncbi:efflux RND transporter periplasmic adaptor subunit [Chitinophaga filiformis]|uniref:efflux RND transporter periplasmic adaptor subunit n=1 Tax=Chitinophaga filiformis TaxID=104663 RepID=UPI001F2EF2BF|nr:efflux RND transporter periplasmic adaptor subunit [Chitinophaga filiformis]MCF6407500.1 efflux RND transporter periplasmic adaptor subunit [Chitinophaga filiformis]